MDMEQKLRKHAESMNENINIEPMVFPEHNNTVTASRKRSRPRIAAAAVIIILGLGLGTVSAASLYGIDIIALISEVLSQTQTVTQEELDEGRWIWLDEDNIAVIVPESPTKIYLSDDCGDTWRESVVYGSDVGYHLGKWLENAQYNNGFIQFSSDGYGCLVLTTGAAMGSEDARVFLSNDSGDTWEEIGNLNDIRRMVVTGAGTSSRNACFISYRYYDYYGPDIWYTTDKGKTWQRLSVELPEKYQIDDNYGFTPLSPEFNGLEGIYPIKVKDFDDENNEYIIYMYSHDGGLTWSFDK